MLQLIRQRTAGEINFHVTVSLIRKEDVKSVQESCDTGMIKTNRKIFQ